MLCLQCTVCTVMCVRGDEGYYDLLATVQVLCLLEGIRVVMETHARLCMVGHCELRPQEPWWTLQQLSHIANVWEWVIAAAILKGGTPHITMVCCNVWSIAVCSS